uniref:Testis expressed 38 n=1 Tax=Podarcis muralis TaxID=64176 RepID=A0A670IJ94_PODMU
MWTNLSIKREFWNHFCLLPIYFGSLGFCYMLVFICMLFLQWRKGIQQKRRAKAWVKQLKTESYFQRALAHKEAEPGNKAEACSPESDSIRKPQDSFSASEITIDSSGDSIPSAQEPYKPVFQEIPCTCVLSHMPPLLEHSASYPCSSIRTKSMPFNSPLKSATLHDFNCTPNKDQMQNNFKTDCVGLSF